ncbi:UNKNOWN [Stylonychia lemnae]|uniref:Uncharacterized protein n=1 Tax=Stylonychia lemnae TaxID=5949 RepID=A0A078BB12_STYLE|nr:UNKNOWN [Stylonychia lemnae]|eukprot:CDW90432.1 UNKNOWN [Stylonychia lemnae]
MSESSDSLNFIKKVIIKNTYEKGMNKMQSDMFNSKKLFSPSESKTYPKNQQSFKNAAIINQQLKNKDESSSKVIENQKTTKYIRKKSKDEKKQNNDIFPKDKKLPDKVQKSINSVNEKKLPLNKMDQEQLDKNESSQNVFKTKKKSISSVKSKVNKEKALDFGNVPYLMFIPKKEQQKDQNEDVEMKSKLLEIESPDTLSENKSINNQKTPINQDDYIPVSKDGLDSQSLRESKKSVQYSSIDFMKYAYFANKTLGANKHITCEEKIQTHINIIKKITSITKYDEQLYRLLAGYELRRSLKYCLQDYSINFHYKQYQDQKSNQISQEVTIKDDYKNQQPSNNQIGIQQNENIDDQFNIEQLAKNSNFFLLFNTFDSPFKIKQEFYQIKETCHILLIELFRYLDLLLEKAQNNENLDWIAGPENRKFLEMISSHLLYVHFKHPSLLQKKNKLEDEILERDIDIYQAYKFENQGNLHNPLQLSAKQMQEIQQAEMEEIDKELLNDSSIISNEGTDLVETSIQDPSVLDDLLFDFSKISKLYQIILKYKIDELDSNIQRCQQSKTYSEGKGDQIPPNSNKDQLLIKKKIVQELRFMEKILTSLNGITPIANQYLELFDQCGYFLMKFKEYIDINFFSSICYQLMKKNPSKKNENLLLEYRKQLASDVESVTRINYQKIIYVLSRSMFPFNEMTLNDIFYNQDGKFRGFKGLKPFHFGSMMPSLARMRYNQIEIINSICNQFSSTIRNDFKYIEPKYIKVFIERLLILDFRLTKDAIVFFKEIKYLLDLNKPALEKSLKEFLEKDQSTIQADLDMLNSRNRIQSSLQDIRIIEQYCDYIIQGDNPDFKIDLMIDQ